MKSKQENSFWPSYTDLMTSLFFIMLVLYVLTYVRLSSTIKLQKEKLTIIETVEQNLKPLKEDPLFVYEEEYKRFKLSFDVKFETNKYNLNPGELENYASTITSINRAGQNLKYIIDNLNVTKNSNPQLRNVSYILVIAGYASKTGDELHNYKLSYERALALRNHWRTKGIDFESEQYQDLIDLQISGNGIGGVGRDIVDVNNQRFLIQIFPKIGDVK